MVQAVCDAVHRAGERIRITDIALNEFDLVAKIREVVNLPGGEVVQYTDIFATPNERFDQMAADESSAAGHQILRQNATSRDKETSHELKELCTARMIS